MSFEYLRKRYGVPAKRGCRIEYTESGRKEYGTIKSASGGGLRIQLDGVKHTMPFHPTWNIRYLDADGNYLDAGMSRCEDCGQYLPTGPCPTSICRMHQKSGVSASDAVVALDREAASEIVSAIAGDLSF